jgi:hypothetical protein
MGYNLSYNPGESYILSDTLIASNATGKTVLGAAYYLVKSISIIKDVYHISSLRTRFDITNGGGGTIRCKIYYNGSAIGTEQGPGIATYTEDFNFTNLRFGDTIELWGTSLPAGSIANFRIYGTESPFYNSVV